MKENKKKETELTHISKKAVKEQNKYKEISTDDGQLDTIDSRIEKDNVITTITKDEDDFIRVSPIKIEKSQKFCCKRIGNTYSFFGDRDGNPIIMIGPHWPMYICFSSIVTVGVILFLYTFWEYLHIFFKVMGIICYSTFIVSYTYTFLINPGYPKHDLDSRTGEPRSKYRFCAECKMWINIDKQTNHCFDCNVCIEGYDHHCPWVSKCIGRRNLNSFYVFIISTLCTFAYIVCAITNAQNNRSNRK